MRVFFFAPIMLPALFIGLSLGTFFNAVHFSLWYPFSLRNVVAAHFLFAFPYFLLIAGAAFERLDPQLEETAADLGATPWQQFRLVTLPLVWIMLAAATLFVIALSFDEFVRTFFVIGAQSTVPMTLWSKFRISIDPSINALASLLLAVTVLGTLAAVLLTLGRGYMRRQLLRR
jgi:spermidine/putrescine transport system permease protein